MRTIVAKSYASRAEDAVVTFNKRIPRWNLECADGRRKITDSFLKEVEFNLRPKGWRRGGGGENIKCKWNNRCEGPGVKSGEKNSDWRSCGRSARQSRRGKTRSNGLMGQSSSVTQSCLTVCDPMNCNTPGLPSLSITISRSSLRLMSIESVMPSSHLTLGRPLLLLPPIPPSIRVFSNESTLRMRWPKSWSFSFSIIPSKEIPGLISFRMDWLDLLAVQGTSRVFSNTTVQKHQFFSAQLSL